MVVSAVPCPQGLPRACLLLLLRERPGHGYELHHRLLGLGQTIEMAALYRLLHTMEDEGLVHSAWETSDQGPARRSYELSWAGQDALRQSAEEVMAQREVIRAYLDRFESIRHRPATLRRPQDPPPPPPVADESAAPAVSGSAVEN